MAFFEMGKYYVTHAAGKTDEGAVEKSMNQYRDCKLMYDEGKLTREAIEAIMMEPKSNQQERIVLRTDRIKPLFPPGLPAARREDYIAAALEYYGRHRQRQIERDDAR